jgi:hypothetical protein
MSTENRCQYNDCKSLATHSKLDGRLTRCDTHKMDDEIYNKIIVFIIKAKQMHGDKYGYWSVIYEKTVEKAIIYCYKCEKYFEQRIYGHLSGNGCRLCKNDRRIQTNLEIYGVENPMQSSEVRERAKQTMIERYGVEYSFQSSEIREKSKQTMIERYGGYTYQSEQLMEQVKNKMKEKHGVEYPTQSKEIKEKIKQTNLKKYGFENLFQSSEVREKAKNFKEYRTPSGSIWKVQGYEPFALNELFKIYTEEQIRYCRKDVPRINYNVDNKTKYYFPDIFIPHENRIIEVKSTRPYKFKTDNIQRKKDATIAAGYNYEIWIYNSKGERVEPESI